MPLNQVYRQVESWHCASGCQYSCDILSVETSPLFLKLKFQCPTCGAVMTRYYDLLKPGYVEATGVRREPSLNQHGSAGNMPCQPYMSCPYQEVKGSIRRGVEIEDCIDKVAEAAAGKCPDLTESQQRYCFNTLFDLNVNESFASFSGPFREAYERCRHRKDAV
jgi:hypothetical protein